ncbi:dihydrodiol dehydrogenase [Streptomyces sp. NA04227]|nr:dihydrodiol dehydrogenase [Streptomyces sp. NA04227]
MVNEFTAVRISKISTRNGHRVEIRSLRLGHHVRLDPLALESISWQTPDVFSRFLDQPFGPEPGPSSP